MCHSRSLKIAPLDIEHIVVLVQCRLVTDRRTNTDSIYHASRGGEDFFSESHKNERLSFHALLGDDNKLFTCCCKHVIQHACPSVQ